MQVNSKVDGKAPVHWAIKSNNIDALKCLLDHHADVNILVSTASIELIDRHADHWLYLERAG